MPKHLVWGEWRSDKELQEIAHEMNRVGRKLVVLQSQIMKASEISAWLKKLAQRNGGLIF